jgi:hypothetical protein
MAKKTEVPAGLREAIHKELNSGMSYKGIASKYNTTNKAMEQYVFEHYRQVGWEWRYR